MAHEITLDTLPGVSAQPTRGLGTAGRAQEAQAVKVPTASQPTGSDATPVKEQSAPAVDGEQLKEMVDDLNGHAQLAKRQLQFVIDDEAQQVYFKVVDTETQEVIREFPYEEIRNMQRHLREVSEMLFEKGESTSLLFEGEV